MHWRIAIRNVLRNKRRTVATVLAIGLACAGLLLFGGYVIWAHLASETHSINISGHLQLFKAGYRTKGAGNPAAYAIQDFAGVKQQLLADVVIGPRVELVTGQLMVVGMVSYAEQRTSTPFVALGAFPDDLERISRWNPYGLYDVRKIAANATLFASGPELEVGDPEGITLGLGMARILDLEMPADAADRSARPIVELVSQPPDGGMVNMISAGVRKLSTRPLEELDSRLIFMPIQQASDLLFPGEPLRVTSITLLLRDTSDLPVVEARLSDLAARGAMPLEWRNCWDLNPNNVRSIRMMDLFFLFAFCIIVVVLTFTIFNTMMMSVMERVREIGTVRAMGASRPEIVRLFAMEGLCLGIAGALIGVLLAGVTSWIINRMEIVYALPMVTMHAKLEVFTGSAPGFVATSLLSCLLVALLGAYFPARRASRMEIADALRQ